MATIDRDWIKKRLTGKHGEKARLAEHMGISKDKFSKIMNGTREVQLNEIPHILAFFGLEHATVGTAFGFAEPSVKPLIVKKPTMELLVQLLSPSIQHCAIYTAPKDYVSFGILHQDILVVDINATPQIGDLVIATINDTERSNQYTALRRHAGDWLFSNDPMQPPEPLISDTQDIGVVGVVKASARPSKGVVIQ